MRALACVVATATAITLCPTGSADAGLSQCAHQKTAINPAQPMGHHDCRLVSSDRKGLAFDVTYWNADAPSAPPMAVKIVVTDASGTETQTINELTEASSPAPVGLEDIDGDGRDEVIVPIARRSYNGGMNTRFSEVQHSSLCRILLWRNRFGAWHDPHDPLPAPPSSSYNPSKGVVLSSEPICAALN